MIKSKLIKFLVFLIVLLNLNVCVAASAVPIITKLIDEYKTSLLLMAGTCIGAYLFNAPDTSTPTVQQLDIITFIPCQNTQEDVFITLKDSHYINQVFNTFNNKTSIVIGPMLYEIYRGIPPEINMFNHTFVYAGGFSNYQNSHALAVYRALTTGVIQGPCIVFTNPNNTWSKFNFCQEQDLACIDLVLQALFEKKSDIKITLFGACQGGTQILRYLAENTTNPYLRYITAAVVESPPVSVEKALQYYPLSHLFWKCVLPNYNAHGTTIMDATEFPAIPIFIGSLPHDSISDLADITKMINHLKILGADIHHFISQEENIHHGRIGKAHDYQEHVKEFYKKLLFL